MRVTQFTMYNNFLNSQQQELSGLNKVQTQLASGKKIEQMYENPVVYTKDLGFQEELNSFEQVKKTASFAKNFADETDSVLNEMIDTLGSFKTKLLDAANDTNNKTTREAIAKELESDLAHIKDLANTSINGKYIFSGSAFDKKPINDNFEYQGNGDKVQAFLGAGVERRYNIDGKSLFLGTDNDYKKHITLNVIQYDKMKQHPEFVVKSNGKFYIDKHLKEHNKIADSSAPPLNKPVNVDSDIRSLTGVEDKYDTNTNSYLDGTSYFYLKGKKPNGENFSVKFALSNSDKVSNLLNKIGEIYGNTATSKVVNVSLNEMGEIQIKNNQNGKAINGFFMVASDKNEESVDDLVKNGDYIVSFQKSNFDSIRNQTQITANNKNFDNRIFKFNTTLKLMDNSRNAISTDSLQKVIGSTAYDPENKKISTIDHLTISGTDTNGNSVSVVVNVNSNNSGGNLVTNSSNNNGGAVAIAPNNTSSSVKTLMDSIKNTFGDVNVSLENGELIVTDNTVSKTESSKLNISIKAEDANGDALEAFRSNDIANSNKLYMQKKGNLLFSNASQIVKDNTIYYKDGEKLIKNNQNQLYATKKSVLMDVIGDDATPKTLNMDFTNLNGEFKKAKIELRDTIKSIDAKYVSNNQNIVFDTTSLSNSTDNYFNVMGNSIINEKEKSVKVAYLKVSDGATTKEIALDNNTTFEDIVNASGGLLSGYSNGKFTTSSDDVTITLQDENQNDLKAGFKSNYQIDLNNDGQISYGEIFNIFNEKGELTPAHTHIKTVSKIDPSTYNIYQSEEETKGVTYKQLGDVVSMLTSNIISPDSFEVYNNNIQKASSKVEVSLDDKGRINIEDKSTISSVLNFSIYGLSLTSKYFSGIDESVNDSGSNQTFAIKVDGDNYSMNVDNNENISTFINDINSGKLKDSNGNSLNVKSYFKNGHIYLDFAKVKGNIENIDDSTLNTDFKNRNDNSFNAQENNAVTIDEPHTDIFATLKEAIEAVKNGQNYSNADSDNPRNFGIQGALKAIEHVMDRVRREDATIGAVSQEFDLSIKRVDMLKNHVTVLKSDNIDTDIGEASIKLNSLTLSYKALLASISKVNNLTLLNYLR